MKLIKGFIDSIEADPAKDLYFWDSLVQGFGLRVRPSGRKMYFLAYRNENRRMRWISIGKHGVVTVDQARSKAKELLANIQLKLGDPADKREEIKGAVSFKTLAGKYLADYAEVRKKPKSLSEDKRYLDKFILKALGNYSVREIDRQDILRLRDSMKTTPIQANRALSLLSVIFNFAEECGARPEGSNPCVKIKKYQERRVERFLSPAELGQLGKVLDDAEQTQIEPQPAIDAIRLLLFTGARKNEILMLRWNEVDLERGLLNLPDSKTGSKVIYLNQAAIDVFENIERTESPWVIPSVRGKEHFIGLQKVWERIRKQAGLDNVRLHDLRHGFASVAAGMGEGLPIIGKLLGHRQASTTQRYAHLADDPLRRTNDRVGEYLQEALRRGGVEIVDISIKKATADTHGEKRVKEN